LTAFNLQTQEVLHVNRVERWDGKIREQVKEV